jgi:hypothetical protein
MAALILLNLVITFIDLEFLSDTRKELKQASYLVFRLETDLQVYNGTHSILRDKDKC